MIPDDELGPRERQIMGIVYRLGRVTAEDVRAELKDPVSNAAVRGMLRILEEKDLVTHDQDGPRYVYYATADRSKVSKSAMKKLVQTFYDNSAGSALVAMLGMFEKNITDEDLERLEEVIRERRRKGGAR
jgi:BlaI family transcriptional regulator, penicillinase repressor